MKTPDKCPIDPRDLEKLGDTYSADTICDSKIRDTYTIAGTTYVCTGRLMWKDKSEVYANEVVKLSDFKGQPISYGDSVKDGCQRRGYEGVLVKHRSDYMVLTGKRVTFIAGPRERRELFDL